MGADEKKKREFEIELGEKNGSSYVPPQASPPRMTPSATKSALDNPMFPILSYCASSILMTVTNKYVVSGTNYNLNFFLLCVQVRHEIFTTNGLVLTSWQSVICTVAIQSLKSAGVITYRDFKTDEAKKCRPAILAAKNALTSIPRVSDITSSNRHDLYFHQSFTIPFSPRLHNLQELDDHIDCIW